MNAPPPLGESGRETRVDLRSIECCAKHERTNTRTAFKRNIIVRRHTSRNISGRTEDRDTMLENTLVYHVHAGIVYVNGELVNVQIRDLDLLRRDVVTIGGGVYQGGEVCYLLNRVRSHKPSRKKSCPHQNTALRARFARMLGAGLPNTTADFERIMQDANMKAEDRLHAAEGVVARKLLKWEGRVEDDEESQTLRRAFAMYRKSQDPANKFNHLLTVNHALRHVELTDNDLQTPVNLLVAYMSSMDKICPGPEPKRPRLINQREVLEIWLASCKDEKLQTLVHLSTGLDHRQRYAIDKRKLDELRPVSLNMDRLPVWHATFTDEIEILTHWHLLATYALFRQENEIIECLKSVHQATSPEIYVMMKLVAAKDRVGIAAALMERDGFMGDEDDLAAVQEIIRGHAFPGLDSQRIILWTRETPPSPPTSIDRWNTVN